MSGRGRGGGRPFGGVLANEAKQEKTKAAHSASLQTDQNSHDRYFAAAAYQLAAIRTMVSKMSRSINL